MTKNRPKIGNLSLGARNNSLGPVGITPHKGQVICGDIDMRIDCHGLWHYMGSPIGRIELIKLFSTVMRRDNIGDHWLITPSEMCRIQVDDAAFRAVELIQEGYGQDQKLTFRTNIDDTFILSTSHPLRIETNPNTGEPAPYIVLDYGLEAKLSRAVFYQLVDLGNARMIKQKKVYGVWSESQFFSIGSAEEIKEN